MSHVSVEQYHDFNQNNVLLAFFKASFIYRFPMKFKVYFTCLKFHAWGLSKTCILYLRAVAHRKNIIIKRAILKVRQ